ncbi:MAG: DUF1292 domain-containing protein [Clostridia bacterium]|nr:DUF1292 domain-containing protein [Clostridia bacterium]MDD4376027.1 DUF1292 domain-containing protein [Clostridia bacterium]
MEEKKEFGCESGCGGCNGGCSPEGLEEMDMEDGILTFTDEEGNEVDFQILDAITVDEKQYLVVLPCEEDESESDEEKDSGVLILEIKNENEEEVYDLVIDDEVAEKVFEEFKKINELE